MFLPTVYRHFVSCSCCSFGWLPFTSTCCLLHLQAIASLLPDDEDADMQDQQHPWGDATATATAGQLATGVPASQPTDSNRKLSHMLLVAAAAASLPCIAAAKCMLLPPQLQQQQQQQGSWRGVGFSGLPGLHVQLQQQLLQLLQHAGGQIRVSDPGCCCCSFVAVVDLKFSHAVIVPVQPARALLLSTMSYAWQAKHAAASHVCGCQVYV